MQSIRRVHWLFPFCIALFSLGLWVQPAFAHRASQEPATPLTARGRDRLGLVEVVLQAAQPAAPGATVELRLEVRPTLAANPLTIQWRLPEGGELLGGADQAILPNQAAQQTVSLVRQVRFAQPGLYPVFAQVSYSHGAALAAAATAVLFFDVRSDGLAAVLHHDPRINIRNQRIIPTTLTVEDATVVRAAATNDPCFTINGTITRLDRNPAPGLPGGDYVNSRVAVRNVAVDMMEEDTLFDDYYGTQVTDELGNFHFQFCDDDGLFDDELELYVVVRAELYKNGRKVVEVEDSSWIDETHEFESGVQESEGGTLRFDMAMDLNADPNNYQAGAAFQSEVFNIADAILQAFDLWNAAGGAVGNDAIFNSAAEVHYEPGFDDDGSYYQSFWNEITIADGAADPDGWDDTVIMHEWTHFADDLYGCDDSPGGEHFLYQAADDPELSWSEGYPNYFQSAVRAARSDPNANWYLDVDGSGAAGGADLENWDTLIPTATLKSALSEVAVAAMLWDLADSANDNGDRVTHGHRMTQEVYTDPAFESNGDIFDDTCTAAVYLWSWRQVNKPTDTATAAAVTQNILEFTNPFGNLAARAVQAAQATAPEQTTVAPSNASEFRWWKQLSWVVDNSASMAGGKFDGVKATINKQLTNLGSDPKGVEFNLYTFNNQGFANQPIVEHKFYPDQITPLVNGLGTASAADDDCAGFVYGLNALTQALPGKRAGDAWLFTDGREAGSPSLATTVQMLAQQRTRGSIALLGGCITPPPDPNQLNDSTEIYLGAASGQQSNSIVPYMLTALRSGGQFLFVNPGQEDAAADILRAQLAHSAGAGRWSDYVSDRFTYRWDRLENGEYSWFPAESLGQDRGQLFSGQYLIYDLPTPFPFYGANSTRVGVDQDGFVRLDPCTGDLCPVIELVRKYLDVLQTDLTWGFEPYPPKTALANNAGVDSPQAPTACASFTPGPGPLVRVFSANFAFEWHIISVQGCDQDNLYRAYQIWLNHQTGEIRYQYEHLRNEGAAAVIGLRRHFLTPFPDGSTEQLLVSGGASSGMGYKFVPAPPAPTRTYTVNVDALIDGVGFLLTGYSGDFEPLLVRDPNGVLVDCNDAANVLCLNLGKVQYVQANVNGRLGKWTAVVDAAAPSNQATFTFNAVAASGVGIEAVGKRSLLRSSPGRLLTKLGRAADNNLLTGWLQSPNGQRMGDPFALFDDGLHDDLLAGDGWFGSALLAAQRSGVAYLWVTGSADGVEFTRADPAALTFQGFKVVALQPRIDYLAGGVTVEVELLNDDSETHCFNADVQAPAGWSYNWDFDEIGPLCLGPNSTDLRNLELFPMWDNAPSGAQAQVTFSFIEEEPGFFSDSDTVTLVRYRPTYSVQIDNEFSSTYIRPNGTDTVTLAVGVFDEQGFSVADGTLVEVQSNLGVITPPALGTVGGIIHVTLTAGNQEGDATLIASAHGITDSTVIYIRNPLPDAIKLTVTPSDLSQAGSATVQATVRDRWGNPMANQSVRIGLEDDSELGAFSSGNLFTGITDGSGQVTTTFVKAAEAAGQVTLRSDLLRTVDGSERVVHSDRETVKLGGAPVPNGSVLYLPIVQR